MVVIAWLLATAGLGAILGVVGTSFTDAVSLPGTSESSVAHHLLAEAGVGGETGSQNGVIVWQTTDGGVTDPSVAGRVEQVLAKVAGVRGVAHVVSPYSAAGAAQLGADGHTAYASLAVGADADTSAIRRLADSLNSSTLHTVTGGAPFKEIPSAGGATEIIGLLAALVILFVVFRSPGAALLPIATGVAGVGLSALVVMLASNAVAVPSTTTAMGSLIGLGVGIDYALFIVNRHRKGLTSGLPLHASVERAVSTSGRAVVFAGGTVIIALLGMRVLGLSLLTGMAMGAAVTVLLTVAAAVTLLPALLALLGTRVLSRQQRRDLAAGELVQDGRSGIWRRWSVTLQRRPRLVAVVAGLLVVGIAAPTLSLRMGSADASSDPASSPTHAYAAMMADGFGAGFDSQLLLVARTPDDASRSAFGSLAATLPSLRSVSNVRATPQEPGQAVGVITVTPSSSAQSETTADLVTQLRNELVPAAEAGSRLQVYVGGRTATDIDFAAALTSKLPVYLLLVGVLGFLLLAIAFRSVVVSLVGALTNLLSIAAGLGAVTAIFQFGWGSSLLGVGSAAPVEPFVAVMIVGIVFGLATDYQVFLVSRMHEEWSATSDNRRAVRVGVTETGRVIAAAAAIMFCVFGSFGLAGERIISELGLGMGVAVLTDALLVRLALVPALMHRLGDRNWWYPKWAERVTTQLSLEGDLAPDDVRVPLAEPTGAAR